MAGSELLIDPLAIQFSPSRRYSVVSANQGVFIESLKTDMSSTGWTTVGLLYATCSIVYPLGFPSTSSVPTTPKTPVGCSNPPFVQIGSQGFTSYDANTSTPNAGPCTFFSVENSPAGGLANLCSAITAATVLDASFVSTGGAGFRVDLTAKAPGALSNFINVQGDGRWGESTQNGFTGFGGYIMQSAPGASQYTCTMVGDPDSAAHIALTFGFLGGSQAQYALTEIGGAFAPTAYSIITNGYGFCVFDGPTTMSGAPPSRQVDLFVQAPYIPTALDPNTPTYQVFDTGAYAVFVLGARTFRTITYWYGQGGAITTCLDAAANTFSNTGGWPRPIAYRAPGPNLTGPAGVPLSIAAYVEFGANNTSAPKVIGKMWDCCMLHAEVSGAQIIQGQRFVAISSQSGASAQTATTLMMCVPAAVEHFAGTCNIFGGGVTRLSGDAFTSAMVGGPITIAGAAYQITSFTNSTTITVTPATVIIAGANWTIP